VDDFLLKKNKSKKTQAAGYNFCHETGKARKSQCIVSSSSLVNGFHMPFKHAFYVGEKYTSKKRFKKKTDIAAGLISRFDQWADEKKIAPAICLVDGGYTNKKIITQVLGSSSFDGFIGRFNKGRKIKTKHFSGLLKDYIATLSIEKDFKPVTVNNAKKLTHTAKMTLDYGPKFKLVIILDGPSFKIKDSRPLITNMVALCATEIAEYYALRWKEETYHQAIKDAFFARTHKFRTAKTLSRYLELINISYGLCEQRRLAKYHGTKTIFQVKNELLTLSKKQFILNLKGNRISKTSQDTLLAKFMV
jgi:hypothetical protein